MMKKLAAPARLCAFLIVIASGVNSPHLSLHLLPFAPTILVSASLHRAPRSVETDLPRSTLLGSVPTGPEGDPSRLRSTGCPESDGRGPGRSARIPHLELTRLERPAASPDDRFGPGTGVGRMSPLATCDAPAPDREMVFRGDPADSTAPGRCRANGPGATGGDAGIGRSQADPVRGGGVPYRSLVRLTHHSITRHLVLVVALCLLGGCDSSQAPSRTRPRTSTTSSCRNTESDLRALQPHWEATAANQPVCDGNLSGFGSAHSRRHLAMLPERQPNCHSRRSARRQPA